MRFVHTPNAICATTETGRVSGAILKRPPEWASSLWDRLAPQVCELLSAQPRGVTCADLIAQGYLQPLPAKGAIELTKAEVQSGVSRVQWAERLIMQLPPNHDGRNSWLLNYGSAPAAIQDVKQSEAQTLQQWVDYGLSIYHEAVKRDETIAELRSALAETQRAVGEAQTTTRRVELCRSDLQNLIQADPGAELYDPKSRSWLRRV